MTHATPFGLGALQLCGVAEMVEKVVSVLSMLVLGLSISKMWVKLTQQPFACPTAYAYAIWLINHRECVNVL